MGVMKWWRARREQQKRPSQHEAQESSPLSVSQIIESIERSTLERQKWEAQNRLEELKANAEERREQREYDRKVKDATRAARVKAAADAREAIRKKRFGRTETGECFVCRNPYSVAITPAHIAEHRKHAPLEG